MSKYQQLFNHMLKEHDIALLDSEMQEIIKICTDTQKASIKEIDFGGHSMDVEGYKPQLHGEKLLEIGSQCKDKHFFTFDESLIIGNSIYRIKQYLSSNTDKSFWVWLVDNGFAVNITKI